MDPAFWSWGLTVLGTAAALASSLAVPFIRETVGKYIAGLVQHRFDQRIETLKSELRRTEDKFSADLRANEQKIRSLTDAALSLRSSRQAALDARRLQAVEKLWAAKISANRMIFAAKLVSHLNLEAMFKAAEDGEQNIQKFAERLDGLTGFDLENDPPLVSAVSEQPFLPSNVWALFFAYQGVMINSVVTLKALALGTTQYLNKEDTLKASMLSVLPEYTDYIEKYGFSGYYHLLEPLDKKLLMAVQEMLDGKDVDDATLKRSAEIMSTAQTLNTEKTLEIPEALRGPEIPEPPKM